MRTRRFGPIPNHIPVCRYSRWTLRYMVEAEGASVPRRRDSERHEPGLNRRLLWRNMGGSKPEWVDANGERNLGRGLHVALVRTPASQDTAARAVAPEPITASKLFFVRNRLVASGAVAAAALSVVAGLSIGAGPMAQSVLSASGPVSAHSSTHHDDGAERRPARQARRARPPSERSASPGGSGPVSVGKHFLRPGSAIVASTLSPQQTDAAPTAVLTVVGTGPTTPAARATGTAATTTTTTTTTRPTRRRRHPRPRRQRPSRSRRPRAAPPRSAAGRPAPGVAGRSGNRAHGQRPGTTGKHGQRRYRHDRQHRAAATPATPATRAAPATGHGWRRHGHGGDGHGWGDGDGDGAPTTGRPRRGTAPDRVTSMPPAAVAWAREARASAGKHADAGTLASRRKRGQP